MRQVTIKQLRDNLSKELESVPFIITKNGKPLAKCTQCELGDVVGDVPTVESVQSSPESVHFVPTDKSFRYAGSPVDATEWARNHKLPNRQDRPVRDLSKEAQAKGKMGH